MKKNIILCREDVLVCKEEIILYRERILLLWQNILLYQEKNLFSWEKIILCREESTYIERKTCVYIMVNNIKKVYVKFCRSSYNIYLQMRLITEVVEKNFERCLRIILVLFSVSKILERVIVLCY